MSKKAGEDVNYLLLQSSGTSIMVQAWNWLGDAEHPQNHATYVGTEGGEAED